MSPEIRTHSVDDLARFDGINVGEYLVTDGELSGHVFASNGTSMVYDLTDGKSIDADTIAEADQIVASGR